MARATWWLLPRDLPRVLVVIWSAQLIMFVTTQNIGKPLLDTSRYKQIFLKFGYTVKYTW
jgi:steroid 5-alpha reductase family enzyme